MCLGKPQKSPFFSGQATKALPLPPPGTFFAASLMLSKNLDIFGSPFTAPDSRYNQGSNLAY